MKQIIVKNIMLPLGQGEHDALKKAEKLLTPLLCGEKIVSRSIYKKSIDARKKDDIRLVYTVLLEMQRLPKSLDEGKLARIGGAVLKDATLDLPMGSEPMKERPIVVGFGPGGMFAALLLAKQGYRPLVIERGSDVDDRARAVDEFYRTGVLNTSTNIQFGAGGAGTFSDGKLVTRINDPRLRFVLETLEANGAPKEILTCAKPHIGTDRLRGVVKSLRDGIRALGGEILFDTKLEGIVCDRQGRVKAVKTSGGEIACGALLLAIGHSARDTYAMLGRSGVSMVPKPFSVGVRIEHLQEDIDRALYGKHAGHPDLGKGEYALSKRVGEDAVYTFCMCPGGQVMAAASEEGGVVTNGMSAYARDGRNANAAVAVSVFPEDGIAFQRKLEQAAFVMGGKNYSAPMQTVGDFLSGKAGTSPQRIQPTYMDGRVSQGDLSQLFPERINEMLRLGLNDFDRKIHGFAAPDAILTGVETRTSAPLRMTRDQATYLAIGWENIYPCGEGAGYAGGISSAAVDGIACAQAMMAKYAPMKKD